MNFYFFFFFSSRRRHTRCLSDWSSDVCSSDLHVLEQVFQLGGLFLRELHVAELPLTEQRDLARLAFVAERHDVFACGRSEEHTSELQSLRHLVCRLLLEKKKKQK